MARNTKCVKCVSMIYGYEEIEKNYNVYIPIHIFVAS